VHGGLKLVIRYNEIMKLPNLVLFKKSFVSLVISPRKLKVVKLNTKQEEVIKAVQVDVPPGVIVNYRVKEKEALVELITELWNKNKIRDRFVGVVVPEFSSYTKSLELPNLTDIEINEAVSYKVQEFLPTSLEDVVFDWKLVNRSRDKARVLVVAILKDILFDYIDAVGEAGLFPLVVETPSLSIQRIVDKDPLGKLIIFMNPNEALIIVANEGDIVATSIINSGKIEEIVALAQQVLTHYSYVNFQKVLVCGVGLTQDFVQFLNFNLGRPVSFADVKIKGLMQGQIQDFLIGISLQYKDPAEPASEKTINLLPPSWAKFYRSQSSGIRAWTLTLIVSIVIWSVFIFVFMVFMFLGIKAQNLSSNGLQAKSQELNEVVSKINEINKFAENVSEIEKKLIYPQDIFNLLSKSKTEGITIGGYKINYQTGEIILKGTAANRANLIAFKKSLESEEKLLNVSLPVSSLVQEVNINFELSAVYRDLEQKKDRPAKIKL